MEPADIKPEQINAIAGKDVHEGGLLAEPPNSLDIKAASQTETSPVDERVPLSESLGLISSFVETTSTISPRSSTPGTDVLKALESSIPRPRTLRVTTTIAQKAGTPPISAVTEKSADPLGAIKQHSRQPSISSVSQSRTSTPGISERGSFMDASRASSPPPSIVGSAPERGKSKNQLRKERKAKVKEVAEPKDEGSAVSTPIKVEEVAPIISRQKKRRRVEVMPKAESEASAVVASQPGESEKPAILETVKMTREVPAQITKDKGKAAKEPEKPKTNASIAMKDDSKKGSPSPPAIKAEQKPPPQPRPLPSYTLGNLFGEFGKLDTPESLSKLLNENISSMQRLLNQLFDSKELDPTGPLFQPPPLASYRLPPDAQKGAEYLDANGYTMSSPFGEVYLTSKEKKALQNGQAVHISDASRPNDLLRRTMITPNGAVYRHLSQEEEERVLELEKRSQAHVRDFGAFGKAERKKVDEGDFANVMGGLEELLGWGARHGVSWVTAEGDNGDPLTDEDAFGDSEDLSDDGTDTLAVIGGGLHATSALGTSVPTAPGANAANMPAKGDGARTVHDQAQNLRAMDLEKLNQRIKETKDEMDLLRKEVETMEKKWGKKTREAARWKDTVLKMGKGLAGID